MNRQIIYIAAYPKSGSTWLTRLLADVLDSPSGGCMSSEDSKEIATEGQDRPGNYIVRKGHFVLIDDNGGPAVPSPHRMAWRQLTTEKIVFLVRDPRDICVSGAYHWRQSLAEFLDRMIQGDVARCGRWDTYYNYAEGKFNWGNGADFAKYENLLSSPRLELHTMLDALDIYPIDLDRIDKAIKRQSFATHKAQIGNDEKELRRNNMRKGIAGDWRNHFTTEMNDKIWNEFGWIMKRLEYERN